MNADRDAVTSLLHDQAFPTETIEVEPVRIEPVFYLDTKGNHTNAIESYVVRQTIGVWSADVGKIGRLAKAADTLIAKGIELNADAPTYVFTKLNDMKLEMLTEAAANAHERAQRMIEGGGGRLGGVRSASQGVFQITPAFSTDVSGEGENDTTSIGKAMKAVVTIEFAVQ